VSTVAVSRIVGCSDVTLAHRPWIKTYLGTR
jgi:hypothetical protein